MIKKNTLTPLILAGIFVFMLGLSFAAVPLYDLFCRVTGFGGTTQISKEAPNIVLDKKINVRLDTNVNSALDWNFDVDQKTWMFSQARYTELNLKWKTREMKFHLL